MSDLDAVRVPEPICEVHIPNDTLAQPTPLCELQSDWACFSTATPSARTDGNTGDWISFADAVFRCDCLTYVFREYSMELPKLVYGINLLFCLWAAEALVYKVTFFGLFSAVLKFVQEACESGGVSLPSLGALLASMACHAILVTLTMWTLKRKFCCSRTCHDFDRTYILFTQGMLASLMGKSDLSREINDCSRYCIFSLWPSLFLQMVKTLWITAIGYWSSSIIAEASPSFAGWIPWIPSTLCFVRIASTIGTGKTPSIADLALCPLSF